jgi:GH15 family glucan-1,4-alpha-glucosidase
MAVDLPTAAVVSAGTEPADRTRYLPIAEHGLIGDLHTVALVGTDGTIDWYCCPRFDSPSVFAALLDADRGGRFRIAPEGDGWTSKQLYLPDTTVLITRFLAPGGVGEVHDFMPPARAGAAAHRHRVIRRILVVRGRMDFLVEVAPRFDYARARHEVVLHPHAVLFHTPLLELGLSASCPLEIVYGRDVRAHISLRAGETATLVLERIDHGRVPKPYTDDTVAAEFDATVAFWRSWLRRSRYGGRWREMVHRSALTLKLLTYAPTGAIVAAPTTSLPDRSAGRATGTTATPGCGTPPSPSTHCSDSGSPRRLARSCSGWRIECAPAATMSPGRCRSCTASTAARTCRRRSLHTWRATWAPHRCASATPRQPSSSSTSTAS